MDSVSDILLNWRVGGIFFLRDIHTLEEEEEEKDRNMVFRSSDVGVKFLN